MASTYAIPDLHGRHDLLVRALASIARHADGSVGTIVTLGDYVDHGTQSNQVIQCLMEWRWPDWNLVTLKGNHDEVMRLTCCGTIPPVAWVLNGGARTLRSYGHPIQGNIDLSFIPCEHLEWLAKLPSMHVDKFRLFVHAGIDRQLPLDQQTSEQLLWKLYEDSDQGGYGELHVVHGHHQFHDGPVRKAGRTNLDTAAWLTGRLTIGVFDDDRPGGPIDLIEIVGAPADR
jgi:serine/threonine protein phosphatase 1